LLTSKDSGSNGKWLVLCEELFEEVCCEFTIRKLDLTPGEIRAIFDAEWVSQVTYGTCGDTLPAATRCTVLIAIQNLLQNQLAQDDGTHSELRINSDHAHQT